MCVNLYGCVTEPCMQPWCGRPTAAWLVVAVIQSRTLLICGCFSFVLFGGEDDFLMESAKEVFYGTGGAYEWSRDDEKRFVFISNSSFYYLFHNFLSCTCRTCGRMNVWVLLMRRRSRDIHIQSPPPQGGVGGVPAHINTC